MDGYKKSVKTVLRDCLKLKKIYHFRPSCQSKNVQEDSYWFHFTAAKRTANFYQLFGCLKYPNIMYNKSLLFSKTQWGSELQTFK